MLLAVMFNVAQVWADPSTGGWSKTYGGANYDYAYALVQTGDGGYALTGSYTPDAFEDHFWLVKTDAFGNAQWSKTYGGTGGNSANALVETGDGGYALAGRTESFGAGGPDFWLVRTDANGVVPEFPSYMILAVLLVVTSLMVVLKEVSRKPNPAFRASSHLQDV